MLTIISRRRIKGHIRNTNKFSLTVDRLIGDQLCAHCIGVGPTLLVLEFFLAEEMVTVSERMRLLPSVCSLSTIFAVFIDLTVFIADEWLGL